MAKKGEEQRYFDREFKYEAIRLMNEGKRSVREIANDLDVHPNMLHQWRRKYRAEMEQAFPGKGHLKAPEEEIRRLQALDVSISCHTYRMDRIK